MVVCCSQRAFTHGSTGLRETEVTLGEERKRSQQLSQDVQQLQIERETFLRNEQQTISLLVSEKASLASELERLEGLESGMDSLNGSWLLTDVA